MALLKRFGSYGPYWGNDFVSSKALSQSQMELNAIYIYRYLSAKGWTINAIAGLLGNLQHESSINPGRWEGDSVGNGPGYGLVQWTPYTKYTEWVGSPGDPSTMDNNLKRIIYEVENNVQYYATPDYTESFKAFTTSTKEPYYLACAFAWNYERSYVVLYGTEEEKAALREKRGGSANDWYFFLNETTITPDKDKKKYNFILFNRRRKIRG